MNHTDWILKKFPVLKDESGSVTFGCINQAKAQTKALRFILSSLLFVLLFFAVSFLLSFNDISSFLSGVEWLVYLITGMMGVLISEAISKIIIRQKLTVIIRTVL